MIDEKKFVEELDKKSKEQDERCGYFRRSGDRRSSLICAGITVGLVEAKKIIDEQAKVGEWIPCSEQLPNDRKEKLVYLSSNRVTVAVYNEHRLPHSGDSIGWGYRAPDGYIDFEKETVIAWRPLPEPYRQNDEQEKKQTNADRIRSMSDEELAMCTMCPNENGLGEIECNKSDSCNCYECIVKWLQSEVEE